MHVNVSPRPGADDILYAARAQAGVGSRESWVRSFHRTRRARARAHHRMGNK